MKQEAALKDVMRPERNEDIDTLPALQGSPVRSDTMPQAIASSTASPVAAYGGGKPSAASLQAQLQRYEQQLSDCVNCSSAKTARGKSDIEAIAARISQVKLRIADSATGQPAQAGAATQPAPGALSSTPLGSRIDVFA